jgi:FtsZ-binding cell division protein ZapB
MDTNINVSEQLKEILTQFVASMISDEGALTRDQFLYSNSHAIRLVGIFEDLRNENTSLMADNADLRDEIGYLRNENTSLMTDNADLRDEIGSLRQRMEEQERNTAINNNVRESVLLLERALNLLGGSAQSSGLPVYESIPRDEDIDLDRELAPETEETATIEYFTPDPLDIETEHDSEEENEEENEEEYDSEEDMEYENFDEDSLDLEDEDLESVQPEVSSPTPIIKNPEIAEDFTSVDNIPMVTLVFVKYSHLPYHYHIGDVRYKIVLNGSQIVSVTV